MDIADLKFSLNSFWQLDLPRLLINIGDYADKPNFPICEQHQKCWIAADKENEKKSLLILILL